MNEKVGRILLNVYPYYKQIAISLPLIFNYLIGNADAHGKNFSLLYQDGRVTMAPCYDLLSTAVYPEVSQKMAMKIGGKYNPDELCLRHWQRLVPDTAAARKALGKDLFYMSSIILQTASRLSDKLISEGINAAIYSNILSIIEKRSSRLLKQLPEH